MFSHPAFILTKEACYTESKALFAKENISAVTGVNTPDSVIFREVADITIFFIYISFAM
jgi:hypothetical protein